MYSVLGATSFVLPVTACTALDPLISKASLPSVHSFFLVGGKSCERNNVLVDLISALVIILFWSVLRTRELVDILPEKLGTTIVPKLSSTLPSLTHYINVCDGYS